MLNSSLRMITKVQLSKHQGPAIKIHYLTTLSILSNQDIPAHPSTDTPLFFLKTLLRYLLLCPSRGSLPNLSLPSPGNNISFVPRIWCLGVFSMDSEAPGVWVCSLWNPRPQHLGVFCVESVALTVFNFRLSNIYAEQTERFLFTFVKNCFEKPRSHFLRVYSFCTLTKFSDQSHGQLSPNVHRMSLCSSFG